MDELERLRAQMELMSDRLQKIDVEGSAATRYQFRSYERELKDVREDLAEIKAMVATKAEAKEVEELKQDAKDNRRIIRSSLITSTLGVASSVIVGIILYVLLGGPR